MTDTDLALRIDNRKKLWLTEISRETFEGQGIEDLESDGGVFFVIEDEVEGQFEVVAKAASFWAGEALLQLMSRALGRSLDQFVE
jgi:hypothetical protein